MQKNWTGIAIALGPLMLVATIVWEIARTNPAFTALVNPWSIKGHETVHGWVFFWLGIALLIGGLLVISSWSTTSVGRLVTLGYFIGAGVALAVGFAPDSYTLTLQPVLSMLVALFLALIVFRFGKDALVRLVPAFRRSWASGLLLLVLWVVTFLILRVSLVGKQIELATSVAIAILTAILAVYAVATTPRGLAANRMLIYVTLLAFVVVITSAGAIRTTLLRFQVEAEGVSAQYKDVQISAGWFLAGLGLIVLFLGTVGLWAKRRDLLVAQERQRKQRAAAEKSAAELKAAEEAYLARTATNG